MYDAFLCKIDHGCFTHGILQPDMWGVAPSDRWDWGALRETIAKNGVRNSLLIAPMLTASTSQILENNECFEPYTSNIYSRRVQSYAVKKKDLIERVVNANYEVLNHVEITVVLL